MSETKTFILQDVINDLIDVKSSLEGALFKLNYFGRMIKNEELINYTNAEISGYKGMEAPDYRKGIATLKINLQTAYGDETTRELPISMLPAPLNERMRYHTIFDGVRVIEHMTQNTDPVKNQLLMTGLPMEMVTQIQPAASKLYRVDGGITVTGAMILANANILPQILSTVRSRLLGFCMQLAETYSFEIDLVPFKTDQAVNNNVVNNYFRTEVINKGHNNVINTGSGTEIDVTRN